MHSDNDFRKLTRVLREENAALRAHCELLRKASRELHKAARAAQLRSLGLRETSAAIVADAKETVDRLKSR